MLSIRNLGHTYPNGVQALNNVNLEISKGMFGLLGANGAGKSSLMRTIATLQQPTTGSVTFGNIDVLSDPGSLRRVLGYLPQEFGVYPRGSAEELLDYLAALKGFINRSVRRALVENLLQKTNLLDVRKKRVATFSGGMRRRFGIAQALIGDPKLLIVDEPTAGLDPEERNRFYNLLSEVSEEVVVILSTHIVDDVSVLCPNLGIISRGAVVSQGTPAGLIAEIDGKIWEKIISKQELDTYKKKYNVISSHLVSGNTFIRILASSSPDEGFESVSGNLEDVYFLSIQSGRDGTIEERSFQYTYKNV